MAKKSLVGEYVQSVRATLLSTHPRHRDMVDTAIELSDPGTVERGDTINLNLNYQVPEKFPYPEAPKEVTLSLVVETLPERTLIYRQYFDMPITEGDYISLPITIYASDLEKGIEHVH